MAGDGGFSGMNFVVQATLASMTHLSSIGACLFLGAGCFDIPSF
jgi:hypothetical protein